MLTTFFVALRIGAASVEMAAWNDTRRAVGRGEGVEHPHDVDHDRRRDHGRVIVNAVGELARQ